MQAADIMTPGTAQEKQGAVYKQLLLTLIGGQAAIVLLLITLPLILLYAAGVRSPGDTIAVRSLWPVYLISLAVLAAGFATMTITLMRILTRRVTALTMLARQQIARDDLPADKSTLQGDAFEQLSNELYRLFDAYQNSLQDLKRRADTLSMLNTIADTANGTFDLQQVFDTTLEELLNNLGWDMGAVYLWDERTASLDLVSLRGIPEPMVRRRLSYNLGEGTVGRAAKTCTLARSQESDPAGDNLAREIALPLLSVPGTLLGVLNIGSMQQTQLDEQDLNLLATVAQQVALTVDKSQLYLTVSAHADELEKQVAARTQELAEAVDELSVALERAKEADKLKSMLLSTVSHELRTPLATIKGNASLILEYHERIERDMLLEHLQDIEEESDKLNDLIANLLEMSRIESGMLHIERAPLRLEDVLEGTVSAARIRHRDHDISLRLPDSLPIIYGDPRRIEQIVANLVDNAAKYSPSGTDINIRASVDDSQIVVVVEDHGQGITKEHQEHIFERFYQITPTQPGKRGIGLGLAICQGLVEAHHGQIWVESEPGQGSTFSFSLPLATSEIIAQESQT